MTKAVLSVAGIGKCYHLPPGRRPPYETLREAIGTSLTRWLRDDPASPTRSRHRTRGEEFWALRDVSFDVAEGAILGIIGVNGAGKSTLLKIISRITEPTCGRIIIDGRVASLLEVGTGFHRELTGRENIFLNGAILGMRRAEIAARFDEIVDFAEVSQFIDTPVKHYSSGMYVRLAFAVAANVNPDILIVDEVLAVGDARFQRKCIGKMEEVARNKGRTVIFVSHAMATVRTLCTSAIWLDKGRVRMEGATGSVIHSYLDSVLEKGHDRTILGALPRLWPGHGEQLLITGIDVNNGMSVIFGSELRLSVEVEIMAPLHDVGFEIGFGSLDGVRVLTIDSNMAEPGMDIERSGRIRASVLVPSIKLQPGMYTIDVAARSGDHAGLDYLPACAALTVNPGPDTASVVFRETHGIREESNWTWDREP